jgi:ribonuclease-3
MARQEPVFVVGGGSVVGGSVNGLVAADDPPASAEPLTREAIEYVIGMKVVDFEKYRRVFTHKSAARATGVQSYERYEFIGDSVINFVIGKYLFDQFPDRDEGFLTKVRTRMVCSKTLARLGRELGLHRYIVMNAKALRQGWNTNTRLLEDAFEALVGCVYIDLGLMTAKTFVLAVMERFLDPRELMTDTNYKDILMRNQQALGMPLPEYAVVGSERGVFTVRASVARPDGRVVAGAGADTCKKGAEQRAAHAVLALL